VTLTRAGVHFSTGSLYCRMSALLRATRTTGLERAGGLLMRVIVLATAICFSLASLATADDADAAIKRATAIPPQPLAPALQTLIKERDIQLVYRAELVTDRNTAGASGELTAVEALGQLLNGTGLTYRYLDEKTITLLPLPSARASEKEGPSVASPNAAAAAKQNEEPAPASATKGGRSFWDRFRVAQVDQGSTVGSPASGTAPAPETPALLEEIVVSGSRLNRQNVPTPVMTLDAQALREGARPNIAAALNDLPQFKASTAPQTTGGSFTAGTTSIDMRGLGAPRTLVLLEGQRLSGDNDLSLVPSVLVNRVDVVTGSASAAWGSGAVAGVVNIVLDNKLQGLHVGAQGSLSSEEDAGEHRFEAAGGTGFAADRGHLIFGGEFVDNNGLQPKTLRANAARWAVVSNPAFVPGNGQSAFILAPDVGIANVSPGGLILSGVNAGKTFNPDGTLRTFDLGRVSGLNSIGGEASSLDDVVALVAPYTRYAALTRATYDFTDDLRLTADVRHARSYTGYGLLPDASRGNISISIENAFLPAAIRNQMALAGQTSFTTGRFNDDFAFLQLNSARKSTQATLALEGDIGTAWHWKASYSHGDYNEDFDVGNTRITANFNRSVDAVMNPANGQAACRVNIDANTANDDPACVPINLFGYGAPSQQARSYVTATSFSHTERLLDTASLNLRGEAFDLWAGPISVAVGAEGRRDSLDQKVGDLDAARAFATTSFSPAHAHNPTKEGFVAVLLPLVKDVPALRKLEFNGAARITDDATGSITSWKLGLIDQVVDSLQLRVAHSRDIRAPDLGSLYGRTITSLTNISDPQLLQSYAVASTTGANPALESEASLTTTAGFTFAPPSVPRLRLSVDYFDISIENAIATLGAQDVITRCFKGNQALCGTITRGANSLITLVSANLLNLTEIDTAGFDATLEYSLPLERLAKLPGSVGVRSVLTRASKFETNDGVTLTNYLGSQNTIAGANAVNGVPKLRWDATLFYESERFQTNIRSRYISAGDYDRTRDIANNRIGSFVYFDLGLSLRIPHGAGTLFEAYANVDNLLDKDPPIESRNTPTYDVIGRYYTIGARARF